VSYVFHEQQGRPGEQRLVVDGELDLAAAPRLEEWASRVLEAGAKHLVIDLTQTTFIDSTAIRALLRVHELVQAAGISMVISAETSAVLRVFEITGLDKTLPIKRPPPHPAIAKGLKTR
jgi:anti-sigma B factor antagonist